MELRSGPSSVDQHDAAESMIQRPSIDLNHDVSCDKSPQAPRIGKVSAAASVIQMVMVDPDCSPMVEDSRKSR